MDAKWAPHWCLMSHFRTAPAIWGSAGGRTRGGRRAGSHFEMLIICFKCAGTSCSCYNLHRFCGTDEYAVRTPCYIVMPRVTNKTLRDETHIHGFSDVDPKPEATMTRKLHRKVIPKSPRLKPHVLLGYQPSTHPLP